MSPALQRRLLALEARQPCRTGPSVILIKAYGNPEPVGRLVVKSGGAAA